jgi:hypothetical protein
MRKLFLCLVGIHFLSACQTLPKNQVSFPCGSARSPANDPVACEAVFSANPVRRGVPDLGTLRQLLTQYQTHNFGAQENGVGGEFLNSYAQPTSGFYFRGEDYESLDPNRLLLGITFGEVLSQYHHQGDATGDYYKQLGFTEEEGRVAPPRDLVQLFHKAQTMMDQSAEAQHIPAEERPSLVLSFGQPGKKERFFLRPGTDPLPEPPFNILQRPVPGGYSIMGTSTPLAAEPYLQLLRQREVLFDVDMLRHDIGHIIDAIDRPRYFHLYRDFSLKKDQASHSWKDDPAAHAKYGKVVERGDMEFVINEMVYYPRVENLAKIEALLPDLNSRKWAPLKTHQETQFRKSPSELVETAQRLLQNRYVLFSSFGGGARDWSFYAFGRVRQVLTGFHEILSSESTAAQKFMEGDKSTGYVTYLTSEPPEIFFRLERLIKLKQGGDIPKIYLNVLKKLAEEQKMALPAFVDRMIALHIAEIEYRVQSALVYHYTPEQAIADTSLLYEPNGWEKYRQTDTYRYFSTYRRGTPQWYWGVDVADPGA